MLLYEQHCDHKTKPQILSDSKIQTYLAEIPGWQVSTLEQKNNTHCLVRSLKLKNYQQVLQFINTIAEFINKENHHPDIRFGYNQCTIEFTTHSAGGITLFDFICAAKTEQVIQNIQNK